MMRQRLAAAAAGAMLLTVASCGFFHDAGSQTTQQRTIQGVTAVKLLTSGTLSITPGSSETLAVTAGANDQVALTSQVIDGTLILDNKASNTVDGSISYALTVPPLGGIDLSGSGNAGGVGVLTGDAQLTVSGSGNATFTGLDVTSVVADLTGSGDLELGGTSEMQRVTVSGSGSYRGSALTTQEADVEVSGSGDAAVNVAARLSASVSGSGNVTYTGNPPEISKDASGSGAITRG